MPIPFDDLPPRERLRALQRVLAGLAQLSEEDQRLLVARYVDGRSLAELAAERGVAAGVLAARLERAVARLREERAGGTDGENGEGGAGAAGSAHL